MRPGIATIRSRLSHGRRQPRRPQRPPPIRRSIHLRSEPTSQGLRVGGKPGGSVVIAVDRDGQAAFPMIENPSSSKRAASGVVSVERLPASRNAATPTK